MPASLGLFEPVLLTIIFFEGNKMIAGQRNSDLTEGIIWKALIIFTVPILVPLFLRLLHKTMARKNMTG